jgi:hypothetical protein
MTQYLLSVHGSDEEYAAMPPEQMERMYKAVDQVNAEVKAAGAWVFGGGLQPVTSATTVRLKDGETLLTDGPYAETKEYLGGFWIIEAADLDAALDWAKKCAIACEGSVEVRPFQDDSG